jgi:uncharacterized heparinase superfamily protein
MSQRDRIAKQIYATHHKRALPTADRIIENEIRPIEARLTAIVHAAGGTVEGNPTSTINILQRIRELVAIEASGLGARAETPPPHKPIARHL